MGYGCWPDVCFLLKYYSYISIFENNVEQRHANKIQKSNNGRQSAQLRVYIFEPTKQLFKTVLSWKFTLISDSNDKTECSNTTDYTEAEDFQNGTLLSALR